MNKSIHPAEKLEGHISVPADKSIAQRAALFSLLAEGRSEIKNYPQAQDPQTALQCIRLLGAEVIQEGSDVVITGPGRWNMKVPGQEVDCGNSGTVMRLLSGILAGAGIPATLTGDDSLSARPMMRIIEPLMNMGAEITSSEGGYPPLRIERHRELASVDFPLPVPSAQLKSCVLLAGLFGSSPTTVTETLPSRNHTETMLQLPVKQQRNEKIITVSRDHAVRPMKLQIPGDFSSAAFWLVAGSVLNDSEIRLSGTGINPSRSGALNVLERMGADISVIGERTSAGEPVADIVVRSARLKATSIQAEEVPDVIDELPVLSVAMACADGVSHIRGAGELRVKESDRLAAMEKMLQQSGVQNRTYEDGLTITGKPDARLSPGRYLSFHDHRIAMAAAILALKADGVSKIADAEAAAVSYPEFWEHLDILSYR